MKRQIFSLASILLAAGGAVLLLILLIVGIRLLAGRGEDEKDYPLADTWISEDVADVERALKRLLINEAGIPELAVDMIMEITGTGDVTVTFSEDGSLWFGGTGLSFSMGAFTYEKINDSTLSLRYSLNIPVIGDISTSYQAKYTLKKDQLTLNLSGVTIRFRRQQ